MVFVPNPDDLGIEIGDVLIPRLEAERAIREKLQEASIEIGEAISELTESAGGGFVQRHQRGTGVHRQRHNT